MGYLFLIMSNIQVRAAIKAQEAAKKQAKLVYRGIAYLKA